MPEGLFLQKDFLSSEQEQQLAEWLDSELTHAPESSDALKYRRVLHYGRKFRYGSNDVDKSAQAEPFPPLLTTLAQRIQTPVGFIEKIT